MLIRRALLTLALASLGMLMATGASGEGCQSGGRHEAPPAGKHRVDPMPQPDPAPSRSGMGNVQITIWVELSDDEATLTYNIGAGNHSVTAHKPGSHWTLTTRPGQSVAVLMSHKRIGEHGRLWVQIVQLNNGRILYEGDNSENPRGGVIGGGVVVI